MTSRRSFFGALAGLVGLSRVKAGVPPDLKPVKTATEIGLRRHEMRPPDGAMKHYAMIVNPPGTDPAFSFLEYEIPEGDQWFSDFPGFSMPDRKA